MCFLVLCILWAVFKNKSILISDCSFKILFLYILEKLIFFILETSLLKVDKNY